MQSPPACAPFPVGVFATDEGGCFSQSALCVCLCGWRTFCHRHFLLHLSYESCVTLQAQLGVVCDGLKNSELFLVPSLEARVQQL